MKNNIFAGIYIEDCDCCSTSYNIFFGYKDIWEKTKDSKKSLVYQNDFEFISFLQNLKDNNGKKCYNGNSDIDPDEIPFPVLSKTLSYTDDDIPDEIIEYVKSLGFEYCKEFNRDAYYKIIQAPKTWKSSNDFLKVIEISKKYSSFFIKNIDDILSKFFRDWGYLNKINDPSEIAYIRVIYNNGYYDPADRFSFILVKENGKPVLNNGGMPVTLGYLDEFAKDFRESIIKEIIKEYSSGESIKII